MVRVAWKNLLAGKARLGFSVGGVAASVLLISFILGLYRGWNASFGEYLNSVKADVWVSRVGNESFFAPSVVPSTTVVQISQVDGVEAVSPLLTGRLKLHFEDDGYDALILGVPVKGSLEAPEGGVGGPVRIEDGRDVEREGEIVIDKALARQAGIEVGDEVIAGLRRLKTVGISSGGNVIVGQLCFVTLAEARTIIGYEGFYNFVLLKTKPGSASTVAQNVTNDVPGVNAFEGDDFVAASREVLSRNMRPIMAVILVLAFLVGTIVVALTVYTAVIEKEKEYGVMKALGTPGSGLFAIVLQQSIACCLVGFVVGEVLTIFAASSAERWVPQFVTLIRWQDMVAVFFATGLMSVVAALVPTSRLVRVDPLTVFKA